MALCIFAGILFISLFNLIFQGIQGTGMDGRIVSRDVLQATPTATPTVIAPGAEFTDIDLTSMRKACTIFPTSIMSFFCICYCHRL